MLLLLFLTSSVHTASLALTLLLPPPVPQIRVKVAAHNIDYNDHGASYLLLLLREESRPSLVALIPTVPNNSYRF